MVIVLDNLILYYYSFKVNNIVRRGNNYYFHIKENEYSLTKIDDIDNEILKFSHDYHEVILNNFNNYISIINNKKYILEKLKIDSYKNIILNDIINYNENAIIISEKEMYTLSESMSSFIDRFESENSPLKNKSLIINESYDYYIGRAELVIAILNTNKEMKYKIIIQNIKIEHDMCLEKFYTIKNQKKMISVSNIVQYLKSCMYLFEYEEIEKKLKFYIERLRLKKEEIFLLAVMMIYPDEYFKFYSKEKEISKIEKEISNFIKQKESYENKIKKIYNLLSLYTSLPKLY